MLRENDSEEGDEDATIIGDKMTQFQRDLEEIRRRNKEAAEQLKQEQQRVPLSKADEKAMKKMLKEKDKLEREALVERMKQRDADATRQKQGSTVIPNSDMATSSFEELKSMVPELRKASRQAYLKQREEQVLDLYKRNLEDEKRVFGNANLTSIEKRINELKNNLYTLAEKRREKEDQQKLYAFPDAEDETEETDRKANLYNKLHAKYKEDRSRGGAPEQTEEERFMEEKERQAAASTQFKHSRKQ